VTHNKLQTQPSDSSLQDPKPRVLKYHSNFYYVELEGIVYECSVKGLLKKEGTEILVGDTVVIDSRDETNHTARISRVEERFNMLSRPKIANIDQVVIVHPLEEPAFSPYQLDRYLTHVELAGLTPVICISKCDLAASPAALEEIRTLYETTLDYSLVFTSVHQPQTMDRLWQVIDNKMSVLAGLSGAGKSSLLNRLNPDFQLKVQEVSDKIARGQHTTRHVELLEVRPDTYVADTPGFSNLKFNYVLPEQIEAVYRDFAPYRDSCEFSNCLHLDEPGCAVLENLDAVSETRYQSYQEMLDEARQYEQEVQATSRKNEFGYKTIHRKGKEALQILRLKEKSREASRRVMKQEIASIFDEETEEPL
jgi:ribosome biogenesis GTPase